LFGFTKKPFKKNNKTKTIKQNGKEKEIKQFLFFA